EERTGVEAHDAALDNDLRRVPGTVCSGQFSPGLIPQQDVPVILVERVQIAALAGAFPGTPERQLPQPSDFAQQVWHLGRSYQMHGEVSVFCHALVAS